MPRVPRATGKLGEVIKEIDTVNFDSSQHFTAEIFVTRYHYDSLYRMTQAHANAGNDKRQKNAKQNDEANGKFSDGVFRDNPLYEGQVCTIFESIKVN